MADSASSQSRAKVLYKTGVDAANKSNYDYGIQMVQEACKLEPENLPYRKTLREIERRKFGNDPAKVGRLVVTKNGPIRTRAAMAKAKSQWIHVLEICEDAFVNNPWDAAAAEHAADAAEQLGYKEMAEWLLEAVSSHCNDPSFWRHLAHTHELNQHWHKAIHAWERVYKLNPNDQEAKRQINALSASATIARSGLNEAISKAPEGTSGPDAWAAEADELKQSALSPEDRLQKEIEEQPTRVGPYLELADHYKMQNRLDEAEKILRLGLTKNTDDGVLLTAHAEIQISRLQKARDHFLRKAETDPADTSARAKAEQAQAKLTEYEVLELRRRIAARPDDVSLCHKLGVCLARAGQHKEAIAEFQKAARSDPNLKAEALLHAGKSFEATGVMKLAERTYSEALKALEVNDPENLEMLNELHYSLGKVAEAMGDLKSAEDHYNEVAANDYGFRDVAERLRNLNQGPPA
jgi:tetratricopeptide (TPR) repeat protein